MGIINRQDSGTVGALLDAATKKGYPSNVVKIVHDGVSAPDDVIKAAKLVDADEGKAPKKARSTKKAAAEPVEEAADEKS